MENTKIIEEGRRVFELKLKHRKTRDALNETFVQIINEFTNCNGKVIVTGMGKPGHVR